MFKITASVDGMMCGMCESHVNDEIRKSFNVKSVKSSHKKGETIIVSENDIPEGELKAAIEKTGYKLTAYKTEPYQKKKLFSFGK